MKPKLFFNKDFYFQNTTKVIKDISFFFKKHKLLFSDSFLLNKINNKEALYNYSNNSINIPKNFYRLDNNYLQFEKIKKHFGKKTLEFIIKHEFGHLNHHQFLSIQHNVNSESFEYIDLNSNSNYIKTNTSLDNIFDRTLSKPNPIEDFIHMSFMESYADAYAGLTSYLQDKNKSIFSTIHNFRLAKYKELKKSVNLSLKQNYDDTSIAEIYSGNLSTSRYSNFLVSKYIKKNIIDKYSFDKLKEAPISNLHDLMQIEILSSLKEVLKKEIKDNPLFNKQFNNYLTSKNISVESYFESFNNGIIEYKEKFHLTLIHDDFLQKNQDKLIHLIDFHANNKEFQSCDLFKNLLNIEQEQNLYETIQNLNNNNNNRLNQNKEGLSKYIINNFILPPNSLNLLIKNLVSKDISTLKNQEIIQSLDSDTKNYLTNSYNESTKIKNEEIPQLNNYSQDQLIKIFLNKLSDKNKKEFKKLQTKYSIKEISTPYLSSSFNANILNNEITIKYQEEKSNILINIKNIKSQINYSNKETKNIKP